MKPLKILWTSDLHIGLKTNEIDRTNEVVGIVKGVIKRGNKLLKENYNVVFVIGGDIFNTNTPSENDISSFIRIMNMIKKANLETYIIAGNHDSIADPDRLSCLGFIRKSKIGYPSINLIEDIKFLEYNTYDSGPLYFTFLPHITRSVLYNHVKNSKIDKDITTQDYIETKCKRILGKVGEGSQHIVFSHLNVHGAHGGSEENLLKKSEAYLPTSFTNTQLGFVEPIIINGHIHTNSVVNNINIIGSPIFCTFGESGKKYYCEITHTGMIGEKTVIDLIPTNCKPFIQLDLNMVNETRDFFKIDEVVDFIKLIHPESNPVVKVDITINPENNTYNWKNIKEEIESNNCLCKPITPRIVFNRQVRSINQKLELPPQKAVQVYLKKNFSKDKLKMREVYATALKYL